MRNLFLPLGLAAAAWLAPSVARAEPAVPLTLERALALAAAHSFTLSAARRDVDAADGAALQAATRPNPRFNAFVEDTRRDTRTTTATLDFPLELGGKRAARIAAADSARLLARAGLDDAQAQLRAAVIAATFATRVAQERRTLADDSAALATRGADIVGKRVGAGKLSPVDELRARVDQANAQLEALDAAAELQAARQALAALWGAAEPDFGDVIVDIAEPPVRGTAAELAAQLDASPALVASRLEASRRDALVEVERSKAVPDLVVSVGAKRDNALGRHQAIVGVSIPLPFFDRNEGAVHEAAGRARSAADQHQAARRRAASELAQAVHRLSVARTGVQTLRTTVLPNAEQAYAAATTGFEAGKFGFLDVIDAQRALLQARSRTLTLLSDAHQAAAAIDRLLGR